MVGFVCLFKFTVLKGDISDTLDKNLGSFVYLLIPSVQVWLVFCSLGIHTALPIQIRARIWSLLILRLVLKAIGKLWLSSGTFNVRECFH